MVTRTPGGIRFDTKVKSATSSSSFPKATKKSSGSGSEKLAAFKEQAAISAAKGPSKPTIREPTRTAPGQPPSTGPSSLDASPILQQIKTQPTITPQKQKELESLIVSGSKVTTPNPTKREMENVRTIMGKGYQPPASVLGQLGQFRSMTNALNEDIKHRDKRIDTRDARLNTLEKQLDSAENTLKTYDKLIKGKEFTGTEAQYNQYKNAFNRYNILYNAYSSTAKLHNEDIATYNKNIQSIEAKKPTKSAYKVYGKIAAKYDAANLKVSGKLPTGKAAEPTIRKALKANPAYNVLSRTNQSDAEKVVQFSLGAYESVQKKPLKAVVTAASFFVGGAALKGASLAAKTLGAGAKARKAARLLEAGVISAYVLQSGARVVSSKDAKEAGYNVGDIIFNEILPAGMGMKYGYRVVDKIPKTARKIKAGSQAMLKSERASLGRDRRTTVKDKPKQEGLKEFEEIIKRSNEIDRLAADKIFRSSIARSKASGAGYKSKPKKETLAEATTRKLTEQAATGKTPFTSQQTFTPRTAKQKAQDMINTAMQLQDKYNKGLITKEFYLRRRNAIIQNAKDLGAVFGRSKRTYPEYSKEYATFTDSVNKAAKGIGSSTRPSSVAKRGISNALNRVNKVVIRAKASQRSTPMAAPLALPKINSKISTVAAVRTQMQAATKPATRTTTRPSSKTITPTDARQPVKQATPARPARRPPTTRTAKAKTRTLLEIPFIPEFSTPKKTRRTAVRRKTKTSLDTRQFRNEVANIKSIFG